MQILLHLLYRYVPLISWGNLFSTLPLLFGILLRFSHCTIHNLKQCAPYYFLYCSRKLPLIHSINSFSTLLMQIWFVSGIYLVLYHYTFYPCYMSLQFPEVYFHLHYHCCLETYRELPPIISVPCLFLAPFRSLKISRLSFCIVRRAIIPQCSGMSWESCMMMIVPP